MNSDLRGILIEQGVAWHWKPFDVSTRAPGGVEVTSHAVLVPRVTEAQADVSDVATPSAARMTILFIFWDAPKLIRPSPLPKRITAEYHAVRTSLDSK